MTTANSVMKMSIKSNSKTALLNSRLIVTLSEDQLSECENKASEYLLQIISADISPDQKTYELKL